MSRPPAGLVLAFITLGLMFFSLAWGGPESEPGQLDHTARGPVATCRWEPAEQAICEVQRFGERLPTWEVRDSKTGELLHRARQPYVRITLSPTRWRDVIVETERGTPPTFRLQWAPGYLRRIKL